MVFAPLLNGCPGVLFCRLFFFVITVLSCWIQLGCIGGGFNDVPGFWHLYFFSWQTLWLFMVVSSVLKRFGVMFLPRLLVNARHKILE